MSQNPAGFEFNVKPPSNYRPKGIGKYKVIIDWLISNPGKFMRLPIDGVSSEHRNRLWGGMHRQIKIKGLCLHVKDGDDGFLYCSATIRKSTQP